LVVGNTVIVGSSFKEGMTVVTHNNTKGIVRAFDVRTGKLLWTFNTIPRPGEFGNDTWESESWAINGNTGVWTQITVDEEAGLVYLPIVKPPYGVLSAIDLDKGELKWQVAHGDTPDNVRNHPMLQGMNIPKTGQ